LSPVRPVVSLHIIVKRRMSGEVVVPSWLVLGLPGNKIVTKVVFRVGPGFFTCPRKWGGQGLRGAR
jgi:hypothetical protein